MHPQAVGIYRADQVLEGLLLGVITRAVNCRLGVAHSLKGALQVDRCDIDASLEIWSDDVYHGGHGKAVPVQLLIAHHLVAQHKVVLPQIQQRLGFGRLLSFLR